MDTTKGFYSSVAWQSLRGKARARWRRLGLGCGMCRMPLDWDSPGAVSVDHIRPRATHPHLALQITNLQCLHTAPCHNGLKQRMESGTLKAEVGLDGWPITKEAGGM
jgi:5-methylcytosine-specific restriction endonuclease McrA